MRDNQGFTGALHQYWNLSDKPRLDRRNTYFDEVRLSNINSLRVGIVAIVLATAIVVAWSVM